MPSHRDRIDQHNIDNRKRGDRAEDVASWFFRLNGFMSIPSFIVHLDSSQARYSAEGEPIPARTEADLIAVRFPYSRERIAGREMKDYVPLVSRANTGGRAKPLFVLVEVKASLCKMNGPWTNASARNMQRVIRRLGFTPDEDRINEIADSLYSSARWEGNSTIVQYVCVGAQKDPDLYATHDGLLQIDWDEIGGFLFDRFNDFPEKLPDGKVHEQWPTFGKSYGRWFSRQRGVIGREQSQQVVAEWVATGDGLR